MKLLFIASDALEFQHLVRRCKCVQKLDAPVDWARTGMLGDYEVALAVNGVGAKRSGMAVDAIAPSFHPDALVSAGFCGALDTSLSLYENFVATTILAGERRFDVRLPKSAPTHYCAAILSSDRVANTAEQKTMLRQSGAIAVEMEAAGVASRAQSLGLPVFCIKTVTDLADETMANDFNAALRSDGHFDTIKILGSSLLHPWARLPELFRLRARCVLAARSMGDFIADCRF